MFDYLPDETRQWPRPPLSYRYRATRTLHEAFVSAFTTCLRGTLQTAAVTVTHDPWICKSPTSGRPVDDRTADTLRGLQRDSRKAILLNTFAGKPCLRNNGSHSGHDPVAACAGAVANAVESSAMHMMRLNNPLLPRLTAPTARLLTVGG